MSEPTAFETPGTRKKLSVSFHRALTVENVNVLWRARDLSGDFSLNARAERVLRAVDLAFASTIQNYLVKETPDTRPALRKTPLGLE